MCITAYESDFVKILPQRIRTPMYRCKDVYICYRGLQKSSLTVTDFSVELFVDLYIPRCIEFTP
jgi:hypothetical protein